MPSMVASPAALAAMSSTVLAILMILPFADHQMRRLSEPLSRPVVAKVPACPTILGDCGLAM